MKHEDLYLKSQKAGAKTRSVIDRGASKTFDGITAVIVSVVAFSAALVRRKR